MKIALTFLALIVALYGMEAVSWSYDKQDEWKVNDAACGLHRQSPVAINTIEAEPTNIPPVVFYNQDILHTATITNNGHTADLTLDNSPIKPEISDGPLEKGQRYEFQNIHFHWGADDSLGAEHVIDGIQYALEVHIVFRNKKYSTLDEALRRDDGLAVVGRVFKIQQGRTFAPLKPISKAVSAIGKLGSATKIPDFTVAGLLNGIVQNDKQVFHTYKGSLTTPPCSPVVDWLAFVKPISVSSAQLQPFRAMADAQGPIVNNFRDLQDLNGRTVYVRRNSAQSYVHIY